jgi:hypothetical protein
LNDNEMTEQESWERMIETREWLIESEGYTADQLWPEWYPPGTPPPWYQRLLAERNTKP